MTGEAARSAGTGPGAPSALPVVRVAVIVPCYNTSAACFDVVRRALALTPHVLAVNDGSTDDTREHLRRTGAAVLDLPRNAGKGAALRAGIEEALRGADGRLGADVQFIVTLDGDGQHNPEDIPRLLDAARQSSADLVIGGRDVDLMPPRSRFGNRFSRALFYAGTGEDVPDTQSGYRLMSARLARRLLDAVRWGRYETEFAILFTTVGLGFTVASIEIPTIYFDENRRSHFQPFRDSLRVFAVTCRHVMARHFSGAGRR